MPRQPRRMNPHPRYGGGKRLSAADIRRARQQRPPEHEEVPPAEPAPAGQPAVAPEAASAASGQRVPQRLNAAEIRRARQEQRGVVPVRALRPAPQHARPAGRQAAIPVPQPRSRGWSRKRIALVGVPLLALAVVGVMVGDFLLNTRAAYQKIFVTSPPRPVVTVNAQGTPVIVTDPTQIARLPTPTPFPDWSGTDRINILLLGADTNQQRKASGEPALSDTIIIVSIDPATRTVGMMSIPRDTLVPIPGVGTDKINAAFSNGELSAITGPGLVRATVEYNFHIPIHYFAQVDFAGFEKIVDTLGGVTLDVPAPIKDDQYPGEAFNYTRVYFHTGLQHLDGVTALRYVRTRHDDNDFARGNRQQQVLEALRAQGVTLNLLPKAPQLIALLGNTVRTDIPPGDLLRLARLGTEIKPGDIKSYSLLPALSEQWSPGQPYYLIPDWAKVRQIVNQMIPPAAAATPAATQTAPVVERPDLGARVLVENGTHVDKLAARSASKLGEAGFVNVTTAQAPDAGQHPTSQVLSYSPNLATARLVAQTLGLPASAVVAGDPAQANGYVVVAILGDDAPTSSAGSGP